MWPELMLKKMNDEQLDSALLASRRDWNGFTVFDVDLWAEKMVRVSIKTLKERAKHDHI